jgi:hypothetical protein
MLERMVHIATTVHLFLSQNAPATTNIKKKRNVRLPAVLVIIFFGILEVPDSILGQQTGYPNNSVACFTGNERDL